MKKKNNHMQEVIASLQAKGKKLSKAGEWLRDNPKGLGVTIHDMRSVMR